MTAEAKITSIADLMDSLGRSARHAASAIARSSNDERNLALHSVAAAIRGNADEILAANNSDLDAARKSGLAPAMLDRLILDAGRIEAMALVSRR